MTTNMPLKYCRYCGKAMSRRQHSNGSLESYAAYFRRIYCGRGCTQADYLSGNWPHRDQAVDPTPEEIAEMTAEIRAEWTPKQELARRVIQPHAAETPCAYVLNGTPWTQ